MNVLNNISMLSYVPVVLSLSLLLSLSFSLTLYIYIYIYIEQREAADNRLESEENN